MRTYLLLFALMSALSVSACGRRGALEAPGAPEIGALPGEEVGETLPGQTPLFGSASPGALEPSQSKPVAAPERRFILDFLI